MNLENGLKYQRDKKNLDKVLFVSCYGMGTGGVQAVIMQIVRALSEKYRFDVLVFTEKIGFYEEEIKRIGGSVFRIPNYDGNSPLIKQIDFYFRGRKIYEETRKILREHGPYQAIHCNNYYEAAFCLKAAYKENVPVRISHAHGYFGDMSSFFRHSYLKFCRKEIRKYATNCIGCSQNALVELYGDHEGDVITNCVDTGKFIYENYYREEKNSPRLVQVGQYCDNKNQQFSIDVFNKLLSYYPDAELSLVGFGEYESNLRKKVVEMGIENKVFFYSGSGNIAEYLAKADIFLFPSKYEGLGIAPIEAQVMHLKCFVSNSVPREVDMGLCDFLSLELGAEEWADRIVKYWGTRREQHSLNLDYERFKPENVIRQYDNLYSKGGINKL